MESHAGTIALVHSAPVTKRPGGRARKRKHPSRVRGARIEVLVTEDEKAQMQRWADEDGAPNLSMWLREMCGLESEA